MNYDDPFQVPRERLLELKIRDLRRLNRNALRFSAIGWALVLVLLVVLLVRRN